MKCKTTIFITSPTLEPSLTYLCHIVLHGGLVVCAHRSLFASTRYFNFGGMIYICFLSTIPFFFSVHLMGLKLKWCTYVIAQLLFCIVILSLFAWPYFSCGAHKVEGPISVRVLKSTPTISGWVHKSVQLCLKKHL